MNLLHRFVVDDGGVGVVDSRVATDQELSVIILFAVWVRLEQMPVLDVGIDDIRDTLGGIESGNLNEVFQLGPLEFVHLLFGAEGAELAHVECGVPIIQMLVETIQPRKSVYQFPERLYLEDKYLGTYMSVAAPRRESFSRGTSLGTNLLTG